MIKIISAVSKIYNLLQFTIKSTIQKASMKVPDAYAFSLIPCKYQILLKEMSLIFQICYLHIVFFDICVT